MNAPTIVFLGICFALIACVFIQIAKYDPYKVIAASIINGRKYWNLAVSMSAESHCTDVWETIRSKRRIFRKEKIECIMYYLDYCEEQSRINCIINFKHELQAGHLDYLNFDIN